MAGCFPVALGFDLPFPLPPVGFFPTEVSVAAVLF